MINSDTKEIQLDLASYCKTGEYIELPGVTPGRIHHYRRLVFNVIKNTLEQAYPLTFDILGERKWEETVNDFFTNHNPQSPQVWKLPLEFYEWFVENNISKKLGNEYLDDLLLFEWLDIEVFTMPDKEFPKVRQNGDFLTDILQINPEYKIVELDYPVHRSAAKDLAHQKGQYFVLAFRQPETKKVEYVELSIFYVFLLERILNQKAILADVLVEAVNLFGLENQEGINARVSQFFSQLHSKGFVLGFVK